MLVIFTIFSSQLLRCKTFKNYSDVKAGHNTRYLNTVVFTCLDEEENSL